VEELYGSLGNKRFVMNFDGIEKRKMGGPFSIHVFVGKKDKLQEISHEARWKQAPEFAGSAHIFARPKLVGCQTCRVRTHARVGIDVTEAINKFVGDVKGDSMPIKAENIKVVIVKKNGQGVASGVAGVPRPTLQLWQAQQGAPGLAHATTWNID